MMTPKQRILTTIRGKQADRVPFTIYEGLLPRGEIERELRNNGLGLRKACSPYRMEHPNVQVERREYLERGERMIRETIYTPLGRVWQMLRIGKAYGTAWRMDFYIKKPSDYRIVEFLIQDIRYYPDYERFLEAERQMGEDGIVMARLGCSPLQKMLIELMGVERFSVDFYEEKEHFHSLYKTLAKKQRQLLKIIAESPAEIVHCGDNITGEVIGYERFIRYCVPIYNEYSQQLHKKGKYLAIHMDGKLNCLKKAIAKSGVDIIEAFTPPPDGDLSLKEAYSLWKDKVIWINYPSSIHLASPEKIRTCTLNLLREVVPGNRFLLGITEDVPNNVHSKSLITIAETLKENSTLPLKL